MSTSTSKRLSDLLRSTLGLELNKTKAFLDSMCRDDPELKEHVLSVLRNSDYPSYDADETIARRYRLVGRVGAGSFGVVYRARDLLTDEHVAVKVLRRARESDVFRVRREIAALRLLRLPGVVQMIDDGEHDGNTFIAMEWVEGSCFPGAMVDVTWPAIQHTVIALLEILARVHGAGVIHRDLKPANVLVAEGGKPTVLDLGLSGGPGVGLGATQTGTIIGTPEYMAPEQLLGGSATVRTDLYALGVMLYEALAGVAPHVAENLEELRRLRVHQRPALISEHQPDVPENVCVLLDRLLDPREENRPRSAMDALTILRGEPYELESDLRLPRLGGSDEIEALVRAAEEGVSVDLFGGPGLGKTRCLAELSGLLQRQGKEVVWIVSGRRPFESLRAFTTDEEDLLEAGDLAAAVRLLEARVSERLRQGGVILVDDVSEVDRWTGQILDRCRGQGCVIRAVEGDSAAGVHLAPIAEDELRDLFAGPDRLFHLREDAAHELWVRTRGIPLRIVEELSTWIRAGLASRDKEKIRLSREALDRLRAGLRVSSRSRWASGQSAALPWHLEDILSYIELAWPHSRIPLLGAVSGRPAWSLEAEVAELEELGAVHTHADGRIEPLASSDGAYAWSEEKRRDVHERIAGVLSDGEPQRFYHLVAAGSCEHIAREACTLAARLTDVGRLGEASDVVLEALRIVRRQSDTEGELDLLRELARLSLLLATARGIDKALYEIARSEEYGFEVQRIKSVLHSALSVLTGDWERGLEQIEAVPPFEDFGMERMRLSVHVLAARCGPREVEARVVASAKDRVAQLGDPELLAFMNTWTGWLRYREGDYGDAARYHARAAAGTKSALFRLRALSDGTSALLEGFATDEAEDLANKTLTLSREFRHPHHEARSEWLARAIAYRRGEDLVPDLELVEAAKALGAANQEGLICLNEAAIAWRQGQNDIAIELAEHATKRWVEMGRAQGWVLSRSLAILCGAICTAAEVEELITESRQCSIPSIGCQALGLLAQAFPKRAAACRDAARQRAEEVPRESWGFRHEVLSIEEALG